MDIIESYILIYAMQTADHKSVQVHVQVSTDESCWPGSMSVYHAITDSRAVMCNKTGVKVWSVLVYSVLSPYNYYGNSIPDVDTRS